MYNLCFAISLSKFALHIDFGRILSIQINNFLSHFSKRFATIEIETMVESERPQTVINCKHVITSKSKPFKYIMFN